MARYRKIDTRIWNDEKFRGLSGDGRYFFIYLLTSTHSTAWGAYVLDDLYAQADLEISPAKVKACWEEIIKAGLALRCEKTRLVCFPNWFKYNMPENQKTREACINGILSLPKSTILSAYCKRSKWVSEQLANRNLTVSEQSDAEQEQEQEQEHSLPGSLSEALNKTLSEPANGKDHFPEDSAPFKLSKYLFKLISENFPKTKSPDLQKWARNIDLMLRVDHREPDDVGRVIEWAQKDPFWKANILSTQKLRDKFDSLQAKMGGLK